MLSFGYNLYMTVIIAIPYDVGLLVAADARGWKFGCPANEYENPAMQVPMIKIDPVHKFCVGCTGDWSYDEIRKRPHVQDFVVTKLIELGIAHKDRIILAVKDYAKKITCPTAQFQSLDLLVRTTRRLSCTSLLAVSMIQSNRS